MPKSRLLAVHTGVSNAVVIGRKCDGGAVLSFSSLRAHTPLRGRPRERDRGGLLKEQNFGKQLVKFI